jgi:hypothetical protein
MNNYNKLNHTTWDCKYHLIQNPPPKKDMDILVVGSSLLHHPNSAVARMIDKLAGNTAKKELFTP